MKSLLSVMAVALLSFSVGAIELNSYKSTSKVFNDVSDKDFEAMYQSTVPLCVKDGASIKTVNTAFKLANLKYADCSTSEKGSA